MCSSSTRRSRAPASAVALLVCGLAARVAAGDVLRVGVSDDYPPFSADGAGFDVEVAERFAHAIGAEIEWVRFRWPELSERVRAGDVDVAMSGVTWRAERDVDGWMTRAVAVGGPCIVGDVRTPERIGVNRGGILERFARSRFDTESLVLVDDNRSLPERLARGEIDAAVTDTFERTAFPAALDTACDPETDRKVYWIAPERADDLGPELDAWLAAEEPWLDDRRAALLGRSAPRDELDHLIDLIGRRLGLMPLVASAKRAQERPIEDPERERLVITRIRAEARAADVDDALVVAFYETQIDLAKRVQERSTSEATSLSLAHDLRPAIERLDRRIVGALAAIRRSGPRELDPARLRILEPVLTLAELDREIGAVRLAIRETASPKRPLAIP